MSKSIAFFDFDGTITTKDTFLEFIKFSKGQTSFFLGFIILSPILILFKLGLVKNWRAKELTLRYFFAGTNLEEFNIVCVNFCNDRLPQLIREKALIEIQRHQQSNTPIYIVSASPENWLIPWCNKMNLKLISTQLEIIDGKITGRISGFNCHGREKENRIRSLIALDQYENIFAYGDSSGDKELLALANNAFYKPFRE
jgi:phosphatidylglycerophosphatase C